MLNIANEMIQPVFKDKARYKINKLIKYDELMKPLLIEVSDGE